MIRSRSGVLALLAVVLSAVAALPAGATCGLGVCIDARPTWTGGHDTGGRSSGGGGPNIGAIFEGRGLFKDNNWPSKHSDFSLPIFQEKRTRYESRFRGTDPDPRRLKAAEDQRVDAAKAWNALAARLEAMPRTRADAVEAALQRCQEQAKRDLDAISAASDGSLGLKALGAAAFDGAAACPMGALAGGKAHYHEVSVLMAEYARASERLEELLAAEAALNDLARRNKAAVAAMPEALRSPLKPPQPLSVVAEARPLPPPEKVPEEVAKKAKKKLPSLLAAAEALDADASQPKVLAAALKSATDEARAAAGDAAKVLGDKGASPEAADAAAQQVAVAAETLRQLSSLDPLPPSRAPKGDVTLAAGEKAGTVSAVESDGRVSVPSPGLRLEYADRDGAPRLAVTGPDGTVSVPPAVLPAAGDGRALAVKTENGAFGTFSFGPESGAPAPTLAERLERGLPAGEEERAALAREADVTGRPTPSSWESAGLAREAADSGDKAGAAAAFEAARRESPWWADGAWAGALASEAAAGDAAGTSAAADRYAAFASGFPQDPRAAEASERASTLRGRSADLALPPQPRYEQVKVVDRTPRRVSLPLPAFASPSVYFDLGGAALGSSISELHALRFLLYSSRLKFGLGTTAFATYKTPFLARVTTTKGVKDEKLDLAVFFPLEVSFSPINFRVFGNAVVAPQFYMTTSSFGTIRTADIALGEAPYNVGFTDYGLKVPFGALAGFRLGHLSMTSAAGERNAKGVSFAKISEKRSYAAVEIFFGGMFGVPKPL